MSEDDFITIEETYRQDGDTVYKRWRVAGEDNWNEVVMPYHHIPYIHTKLMSKKEFEQVYTPNPH